VPTLHLTDLKLPFVVEADASVMAVESNPQQNKASACLLQQRDEPQTPSILYICL